MRLLLLLVMASSGAFAQLSLGVRGGLPFNDFFHAVSGQGPTTFQSSATRFTLGPTVELHLPAGFGVEADALYRNFQYSASANGVDTLLQNRASNAWEFPLLVKYRMPGPFVRPFLDAGVAWDRWSGYTQLTGLLGLTKSDVSGVNTGFVVGAGIELHLPLVKLSPEVRYSRWGAQNISGLGSLLQTNQNRAEFLVGLTF
ncbi:MAG: PorT family protein [Acidobacteriia bacterium]|nr:PorT family protein [Terriglobia bacterium]